MMEKHRATMQDLVSKLNASKTEKHELEQKIDNMRRKYVTTLQRMRDEVLNSRAELWKKLEDEWVKRKSKVRAEWIKRIGFVREHCERRHVGCRCIELLSIAAE